MITNKGMFIHTHKLTNGSVVIHAHPFDKNTDNQPIKTHSHSQSDYQLISNLEIFFLLVLLSFALSHLLEARKYTKLTSQKLLSNVILLQRDRAPPFLRTS